MRRKAMMSAEVLHDAFAQFPVIYWSGAYWTAMGIIWLVTLDESFFFYELLQ